MICETCRLEDMMFSKILGFILYEKYISACYAIVVYNILVKIIIDIAYTL